MVAEQAAQDLGFVRRAIQRRRGLIADAAPIAWVWAGYVLVGYPLLDFSPKAGAIFLGVGGMVAGIASAILGRWLARRSGESDSREAMSELLHWGSIAVGVMAAVALGMTGQIHGPVIGQVSVLAVAMAYLTAGAHYDRWFAVLGLLLAVGAVVVGLVPGLGWTMLGAILVLGLIAPTLLPRREVRTA